MIQASQLRLGNKFSGAGMIQTVKSIETYNPDQKGYEHLILVEENRNQYKPVDMEPISLTADILLACGFEKIYATYDKEKLAIRMPSDSFRKGRTFFNSWCINEGVPQYLHQLQNLYHSLTGEELEIKL